VPPVRHTVSAVDLVNEGRLFQVTFDRDDGTKFGLVFPPETLAWRAAELGLAPDADRTELIEMILYEPFMPPAPPVPLGTRSRDDALAMNRARVADAKRRVDVNVPTGALDPLQALRDHPVSAGDVSRRRDLITGRAVRTGEVPHDPSAERRFAETGKAP